MTIPAVESWIAELKRHRTSVRSEPIVSQVDVVVAALQALESGSYPPGTFTPGSIIFGGADGSLSQDNAKFFWDDTNFRLGLGVATPQSTIEVNMTGAASFAPVSAFDFHLVSDLTHNVAFLFDRAGGGATQIFRRVNGTFAAPVNIHNADTIGTILNRGYDGAAMSGTAASLTFRATEDWTNAAHGTQFEINTTANGTIVNVLSFTLSSTLLTLPGNILCQGSQTVATLPAAAAGNKGMRTFITDGAAAPVFGAVVTGGGALFLPVFSDGAAWRNG